MTVPNPQITIIVPVPGTVLGTREAISQALWQVGCKTEVVAVHVPLAAEHHTAFFAGHDGKITFHPVNSDDPAEFLHGCLTAGTGDWMAWFRPGMLHDPRQLSRQLAAAKRHAAGAMIACEVFTEQTEVLPVDLSKAAPAGQSNALWMLAEGRLTFDGLLIPRAAAEALAAEATELAQGNMPMVAAALQLLLRLPAVMIPDRLVIEGVTAEPGWRDGTGAVWQTLLAAGNADLRRHIAGGGFDFFTQAWPVLKEHQAGTHDEAFLSGAAVALPPGLISEISLAPTPLDSGSAERLDGASRNIKTPFTLLRGSQEVPKAVVAGQVLQMGPPSASGPAACLSCHHPRFLAQPARHAATPLAGALFRTEALRQALPFLKRGEGAFWAEIMRSGGIAALPARRSLPSAEAARILSDEAIPEAVRHLVRFFDSAWYADQPKAPRGGQPFLVHYLTEGWQQGLDPNPWFDTGWYLKTNSDVRQAGICPFTHFIHYGAAEGRNPHPAVDLAWFARTVLDAEPSAAAYYDLLQRSVAEAAPAPLDHASPSPGGHAPGDLLAGLMDHRAYATAAGLSPENSPGALLDHYLTEGWREGLDPNPWFDTDWYIEANSDVRESGICPLVHYIHHGGREGRRPHPDFDATWYATTHTIDSGPGPEILLHFLTKGLHEGLVPCPELASPEIRIEVLEAAPEERSGLLLDVLALHRRQDALARDLMDTAFYAASCPTFQPSQSDPLTHYREHGQRLGCDPNPFFSTLHYLRGCPGAGVLRRSPLDHYVQTGASEGFDPHPDFDTQWYSRRYLGLTKPTAEALRHFLHEGLDAGFVPTPDLDTLTVRQRLLAAPMEERPRLCLTLRRKRQAEDEQVESLFDADWYCHFMHQHSTPAAARQAFRGGAGRLYANPNPWFDLNWYKAAYLDIADYPANPLDHFVRVGASKGGRPHRHFDTAWYSRTHLAGAPPTAEALVHFLSVGLEYGLVPHPALAGPAVRRALLAVPLENRGATLHRLLDQLDEKGTLTATFGTDYLAGLWCALLCPAAGMEVSLILLLCDVKDRDAAERGAGILSARERAVLVVMDGTVRRLEGRRSTGHTVVMLPPGDGRLAEAATCLGASRAVLFSGTANCRAAADELSRSSIPVADGTAASLIEQLEM